MNCYICDKQTGSSGTRYQVKVAIGICHNCGVGVCSEHSYRALEPGSPLLCPSCAELLKHIKTSQSTVRSALQHA